MNTINSILKITLLLLVLNTLGIHSMNAQVKVNDYGILRLGYEAQGNVHNLIMGEPSTDFPIGKWVFMLTGTNQNSLQLQSGHKVHGFDYFYFEESGRLGIGKVPVTNARLDVAGSIAINGTIVHSSDERLKRDIKPIADLVPHLYSLEGKSYIKSLPEEFLSKEDPQSFLEYGFIAQELQKYFPDLVEKNSDGYLTINYISLIPVMVEALKAQKTGNRRIEKSRFNESTSFLSFPRSNSRHSIGFR